MRQHDSIDALIADSLNNLGGCYEVQGALNKAQQMYAEAIELRTVIFGPDSIQTAESMLNQATVKSAQVNIFFKIKTIIFSFFSL